MKRPKQLETSLMVGKEGRLLTDLKAGGDATANIAAEDWTVTSPGEIEKGTRIKVKEVRGLKLVVEKAES